MGLEAGERQGPGWAPFPVSPSPHPAVPLLFSAAPAVQSKAALGLWRRWHNKAQVSLLLQHSAVEQAGGLGRLSFPRSWALGCLPGTCEPRWHWQHCLLGKACLKGCPELGCT